MTKKNETDIINWLEDYRITYLERDISEIGKIENIDTFARVQRLISSRTAQLLNVSEIAKEAGLAVNTIKRYLHLLEISLQAYLLRPFFINMNKRLVKTPKFYFLDNGLLRTVLGPLSISSGSMYENWIFAELMKWKNWQTGMLELFFYRTASGLEIDFILADENLLLPIEAKAMTKPDYRQTSSIKKFMQEYKDKVQLGIICYQGEEITEIDNNIWAIPDWLLFS